MKRFVVLSMAGFGLTLSALPAHAASGAATPAEHNAGCEQMYQAGKSIFDPLAQSPMKALFGPGEAALCGEQKHVPS